MCNESLAPQIVQQSPASPRRKRHKSLINHSRNVRADIARANADRNRKVYERVFAAYTEFRGTAPIGACNMDPTGKRNGISFSAIEFMADVDRSVATTLGSQRETLYSLVLSELGQDAPKQFSPTALWRLIQRLGRSFDRRGLDPLSYFKTIRRKRFDEQPRATTTPTGTTEEFRSAAKVQQSPERDATDFESGYGFGRIESASYD